MEQKIIEILKDNFKGQDIDKARKELCFLFGVMRSDDPNCPDCGKDELTSLGNYIDTERMSGTEYRCDNCEKEFDFDSYA